MTPKRLTAARLAGVPELEEAFSDTTDTKDIWDGGGRQPRSVGPHVRLLQESLLAMGYELPRFGADGIYGDETTAAVTQLQIDAGHPWHEGHEWEHIGGIAGPNTMAHFDQFDPGGTVGSVTPSGTGIVATGATYAESQDNPFAGFDASTSPPSLLVGLRTRRRVGVQRSPARSDVTFEVGDPAIATVGLIAEGIVVGGEGVGTTVVQAVVGGRVLAELAVTVKAPREERINFFFVSDTADPPRATELDHEKATLLTLRLNRVFRRQANVHFTLGTLRDIVVPTDPGPDDLGAHAVPGELNVFCVWDGLALASPDPAVVLVPGSGCADGIGSPAGGLSLRGARSTTLPAGGLMAPCGSSSDRRRIPAALAAALNP